MCVCRSDVVNENKANARYSMSARFAQDDPLSSPDVRVVPANQEHSFFYLSLEPDESACVSLLSLIRFAGGKSSLRRPFCLRDQKVTVAALPDHCQFMLVALQFARLSWTAARLRAAKSWAARTRSD